MMTRFKLAVVCASIFASWCVAEAQYPGQDQGQDSTQSRDYVGKYITDPDNGKCYQVIALSTPRDQCIQLLQSKGFPIATSGLDPDGSCIAEAASSNCANQGGGYNQGGGNTQGGGYNQGGGNTQGGGYTQGAPVQCDPYQSDGNCTGANGAGTSQGGEQCDPYQEGCTNPYNPSQPPTPPQGGQGSTPPRPPPPSPGSGQQRNLQQRHMSSGNSGASSPTNP